MLQSVLLCITSPELFAALTRHLKLSSVSHISISPSFFFWPSSCFPFFFFKSSILLYYLLLSSWAGGNLILNGPQTEVLLVFHAHIVCSISNQGILWPLHDTRSFCSKGLMVPILVFFCSESDGRNVSVWTCANVVGTHTILLEFRYYFPRENLWLLDYQHLTYW